MSDGERRKRTVDERVNDVSGALDALRMAVREALLRHKRAGHPIAVWHEGAVRWIPAEEIPVSAPEED
jgi:hypothetical protein